MKRIPLFIVLFISLNLYGQEVCNNGIDDDGDLLIDCYDPDCAGHNDCADSYFGHEPTNCPVLPIPDPVFGLNNLWQTSNQIDTRIKPIVADIDNDGTPEVIASHSSANSVYVYDGQTGALEFTINAQRNSFSQSAGVADTDLDGFGEIYLVQNDGLLYCYEHDGSPKVGFANHPVDNGNSSPSFVDFDQDGVPEIYMGDRIYNSITGNTIITGPGISTGEGYSHAFPAAADVLPDAFCTNCSGPELICGNIVYSVDIASNTLINESEMLTYGDGHTSLADWDGDGALDIIVGSLKWGDPRLYIWNPRTQALVTTDAASNVLVNNPLWGNTPNSLSSAANLGLITVADFDGDGLLEMSMTGQDIFITIDNDMTEFWTKTVSDQSRVSQSTAFDFEGDGIMEIVYRDEDSLYIWNAANGNLRDVYLCGSQTRTDGPIVVDLNDDGQANILCACSVAGSSPGGYLHAFNSSTNNWIETRKVWNQHNYVPAYINDDLTVPQFLQNKALAPKQDVYLVQSPIVDFNGDLLWPEQIDLVTVIDSVESALNCTPDSVMSYFTICNQSFDTIYEDYHVSIYNGDPLTGGVLLKHFVASINNLVYTSDSCHTFGTHVPNGNYQLHVVANDDGSAPLASPVISFVECDYLNNSSNHPVSCVSGGCSDPVSASLSPAAPPTQCGGSILLTASQTGVGSFEYIFVGDTGNAVFDTMQIQSTTNTFSATVSGNYRVIVVDPNDPTTCLRVSNIVNVLIDTPPSSAIAGINDSTCFDASSLVGNIPIVGTATWTSLGGAVINSPFTDTSEVSNLDLGVNQFIWSISNGVCPVVHDTVVIFRYALPNANAGFDDSFCQGTSGVSLNGTGAGIGGSYHWLPAVGLDNTSISNPTATPALTTKYYLTVTDSNLCTHTDSVEIVVNALPEVVLTGGVTICNDSIASLTATVTTETRGPYSITYSGNPGNTISGNTPLVISVLPSEVGLYSISSIIDAEGCQGSILGIPQNVRVYPALITVDQGYTCDKNNNRYTVDLDISDGVPNYELNGEQDINTLFNTMGTFTSLPIPIDTSGIGIYNFNVTDASGCSSGSVTVTNNYDCDCEITASLVATGPTTFCDGGDVDIEITMHNGLVGDYSVDYEFTPTNSGITSFSNFTQNGDGSYVLANITESGTLTLTQVADSDCSISLANEIDIVVYDLPSATILGGGTICDNAVDRDTVIINLTNATFNPYSINYTTPGNVATTVNNMADGDSIILEEIGSYSGNTISDGLGCVGNLTMDFSILGETPPSGANAGLDFTFCGSDTSLNATIPIQGNGQWTTDAIGVAIDLINSESSSVFIPEGQTVALFWVVSSGPNCPSISDTVKLTSLKNVIPEVTIAADPGTEICIGETISFIATENNGGTTPIYTWGIDFPVQTGVSNELSISGLNDNQEVCVEMISDLQCVEPKVSVPACLTISVVDSAQALILDEDTMVCTDELPLILTGQGTFGDFYWIGNNTTGETSSILSVNSAGLYSFVVDNGVCPPDTSENIAVAVESPPFIRINSQNHSVYQGESIFLDVSGNGTSFLWTGENTLGLSDVTDEAPWYSPMAPTAGYQYFEITTFSQNMLCSTTEQLTVFVRTPVQIPNAFTPNDDGNNDVWHILGTEAYGDLQVKVFNRWGGLVYESLGNYKPWDGTRNGKPLPVACYYYLINLNDVDNVSYNGTVTIVK